MADESLRKCVPKALLSSITQMLGFDYGRVTEVHIYPDEVDVHHLDQHLKPTVTTIPVDRRTV